LRLLGVLGERKPSLGHFDEKGLMLRTAGCLGHPRFANMMNEGVAVAPVLFPFTGLHLLEFKVHDWGEPFWISSIAASRYRHLPGVAIVANRLF